MADTDQVKLVLNPGGVVAPILRTLQETLEVLSISVIAVQAADLSQPAPHVGNWVGLRFEGNARPPEEKKFAYLNWLFSKGFQEFSRGVRHALEEAYLFVEIIRDVQGRDGAMTWGDMQPVIERSRQRASKMNFPDLMAGVNKGLSSPLHFEEEFLSLQKVRNCLEHRNGVVGNDDVSKETGRLTLTFPRFVVFVTKNGNDVEIGPGHTVEAGELIGFKLASGIREFKLGARIGFSADDLAQIGWGCWAFADDLRRKLPKLKADEP